jgi:hypothetical protein
MKKSSIKPGNRYGRLTVIDLAYTHKDNYYECQCGNKKIVRGSNLTSGGTKSCGCIRAYIPLQIGAVYGKFTVLEYCKRERSVDNHIYLCRCECGTEKYLRGSDVRGGFILSCGCLRKKRV